MASRHWGVSSASLTLVGSVIVQSVFDWDIHNFGLKIPTLPLVTIWWVGWLVWCYSVWWVVWGGEMDWDWFVEATGDAPWVLEVVGTEGEAITGEWVVCGDPRLWLGSDKGWSRSCEDVTGLEGDKFSGGCEVSGVEADGWEAIGICGLGNQVVMLGERDGVGEELEVMPKPLWNGNSSSLNLTCCDIYILPLEVIQRCPLWIGLGPK